MKFPTRGLYAITQTENKTHDVIVSEVEAAIRGGAVVVQYRDKHPQNPVILAKALLNLCHQYTVPLIINDDINLAVTIGADGVHLGKEDGDISLARRHLGTEAIIGVSCYNSIEHALQMQKQGASYVAFGRFFPSSSKPSAAPATLDTLHKAKRLLHIPIVAIGGILPSNGLQLIESGANLVAVIGGIFDGDPEQNANNYQSLFL